MLEVSPKSIITQINIHSIPNTFETLISLITSDIDILMISQAKDR